MTRDEFVQYLEELGYKETKLDIIGPYRAYQHPRMTTNPVLIKSRTVQRLVIFDDGSIGQVESFNFRKSNVFVPEDDLQTQIQTLHKKIQNARGPMILDIHDQDILEAFLDDFSYD